VSEAIISKIIKTILSIILHHVSILAAISGKSNDSFGASRLLTIAYNPLFLIGICDSHGTPT